MLIRAAIISGLDWYIDQVQRELHDYLLTKWGWLDPQGLPSRGAPDASLFKVYGRASRVQKEGGYTAEFYMGDNQGDDYQEVYYDDSLYGLVFFGEGQKIRISEQNEADLHLVAFVRTAGLVTGVDQDYRMDQIIRNDFQSFFKGAPYGFSLESIETGIQNVLRDYPGARRESRLQAADMGTAHAFRLNFSVFYDPERGQVADIGSM